MTQSQANSHVATLIAAAVGLDDAALERARAALPGAEAPQWLDKGTAADIPFNLTDGDDQRALSETLRALFTGVDVVIQPLAHRRKRLFLADMDSTMIGQECIDELAAFVGLKEHVSAITERAMRGEIEFEPALRERVALLKGLPVSVVREVIEKHITLTPGGRALVQTMRKNGAFTCLVSGGFTLFTGVIAEMVGFNEARANVLMVDGDKLAGFVQEPIFGRETKRATLLELCDTLGVAPADALATGDGANDLDMIMEAGLGVAYHAKPAVAAAAPARIEHGDLTALLYMQGYKREEFVE
jgi:phosphoserine phosphatase